MNEEMRDGTSGGMGEHLPPGCAAVSDDLGELALGTLTGRERVAALAHLETCDRCSAEVEALSATADQLLHMAPAAEPPVGFEAGVFERLGLREMPPRRRSWLAWPPKLAVTIAACAIVLAFGLGALLGYGTSGGGHRPAGYGGPPPIEAAAFHAGNSTVGRVYIYAGNPTWLFMYMNDPAWQGMMRCEVVIDQGPTLTLGHFWLSDGKGAWAASVSQPAGRLSEARLVDWRGKVVAVAKLS